MEFPNFCGPFYADSSPTVDCEEAINFYLEQVQSGNSKNKAGYVMKRSPGLTTRFTAASTDTVSGMFALNGHIFAVIGVTVYDFLFDGTNLTTNATYGPIVVDGSKIGFAANPSATQLGIYSAGHVYLIFGGVLSEITWPGVTLAGIALLNQYWLLLSALGDGFFYSEPGDLATGDPLNFRSAEASANKFISIHIDHEQVWLMGNGMISQVFYNDVNDAEEPFKPNPSAVIPRGTAAAATPIYFNNRTWWLGDDGVFYNSNGYLPEPVSTFALQNRWRKYTTLADALTWTVTYNGHQMIRLWFPSADVTWELDTGMPSGLGWHQVAGWDSGQGEYTAHPGMSSCEAFGRQFIGDRTSGKIYTLEPDIYFNDTARVPCERIAPDIHQEGHLVVYPWFELNMQTGLGDGSNGDPDAGTVTPEFEPLMSIWYSNDNGRNWSNEMIRSLGKQAEYQKRVYITPCGMARARAFRIRVSAACPVNINTAYLDNPEALAS
jgi:hypothetical protein